MNTLEYMEEFLTKLKSQVRNIEGENLDFEKIWQSASDKFNEWASKLQTKFSPNTSSLNLKLYFLQCVVEAFHNDNIRTNKEINNLVVKSEPIGDKEFKTYRFGEPVKYKVIDSFITERYV
ncbi:MAG TPA: hypothetical protein VGA85_01300 [Dehalococcoidales bacterium]